MSPPVLSNGPRILKFEASSTTVAQGQAAILRWVVQGATRIWLEEAVEHSDGRRKFELRELGSLAGDGAIQVKPDHTTHYLLNCENQQGVACASLSVRVQVK
jgi:hypothetical protein